MAIAGIRQYVVPCSWWWAVIPLTVYLLIVVRGCINLSHNFFIRSVCSGVATKAVALTFDDGPHPTHTPLILDTLKQHHAPATFFCIGKYIGGNEALLHRMASEGHTVGNHSYSHHFWFDLFGSKRMLVDINACSDAIAATTGKRPQLFRPPYGVMNPNLAKVIKKGGYTSVGWSIRSFDTTANDKEKLLSRITTELRPGAIILLHDTLAITTETLPLIIDTIKKNGYDIWPLDKLREAHA
jgi:peptidoglycan-N-acetylglucosamine deacetylase